MKDRIGFGLGEGEHPPLLLASISKAFAPDKSHRPIPKVTLPSLSLPSLPHIGSKPSPKRKNVTSRPSELAQAGAELQRIVAVVGGVLLAHFGKAAERVSSVRPGLPFHESLKLPWQNIYRQKSASERTRESESLAMNLIERGRDYERRLDVRAAVQCFDEAVRLTPSSLAALCFAAKMWSDLTFFHDVKSDRERQLVNMKALEYAERAIAAHPSHPGGYLSSCISKGRLALFTDNRTKVKLAKEAQEAAQRAIQLGPENDLAHHLMGRWHYEMARLNPFVRTAVRFLYGTTLNSGRKEDALACYNRASEIAPNRLLHHAEAGRILFEMGQAAAAKERFLKALECDVDDINAWQTRFDVEKFLAIIDRRPYRQPSLVPPGLGESNLSTARLLGVSEATVNGRS